MALVLFTGGARSGKSGAAQALAEKRAAGAGSEPVTVAVFAKVADDPELAARVERHRSDRPDAFDTLEVEAGDASWLAAVPADHLLLVDCLGTWLSLAMLDAWEAHDADLQTAGDSLPDGLEADLADRCSELVSALLARGGDTIVVTNEVGDGLVPDYASGRLFRDLLGQANRRIVGSADAAYLVVAGRLFDLSALPREAHWPED